MCGITGVVSANRQASDLLVNSLELLEHRGYDSAGLVTIEGQEFRLLRSVGKLRVLKELLLHNNLEGRVGIGHTRWATHGSVSERNAHPHIVGRVAVVHNGVVSNFEDLVAEFSFLNKKSETDSEVIAYLLNHFIEQGETPQNAIFRVVPLLKGTLTFVALFLDEPDCLFGVNCGASLVVGYGVNEMFLASEIRALGRCTNSVCRLEKGECVTLYADRACLWDVEGRVIERDFKDIDVVRYCGEDKGVYRHYMQQEIFTQPEMMKKILSYGKENGFVSAALKEAVLGCKSVIFLACGTSYFAALVMKMWLENLVGIKAEVEFASEFCMRERVVVDETLSICVSQSGETIDTLLALRRCKSLGMPVLSIVNADMSSMASESDFVLLTHAGVEVGVASTKSFTAHLLVFFMFAVRIAFLKGEISAEDKEGFFQDLSSLVASVDAVLNLKDLPHVASHLGGAHLVLYLAKGVLYPISLEGALKLKEVAYISAQAYPAGEMKHGPIALVDEGVVAICLVSQYDVDKMSVSLSELRSRGAHLVCIVDESSYDKVKMMSDITLTVPDTSVYLLPMMYVFSMQLIAYHVALEKGTDIDQPRNLAKTVTVE